VHYTLCLLAATWVAADPPQSLPQPQTPESAPVVIQQAAPMPTMVHPSEMYRPVRMQQPTLSDRIRSWFTPAPRSASRAPMPSHRSQPISPASYREPVRQHQQMLPMSKTQQMPQGLPTSRTAGMLSPAELQKVGHDPEYTWITGKLLRVGGRWSIVYAGPDEIDRFGGSLPVVAPNNAAGVQEGDIVCVHGQVVSQNGRGAYYQAREVNLVERGRR
jgi:hypothetical protein